MYSYSIRAAAGISRSTVLRSSVLGQFGVTRGGAAAAVAAPGSGRSLSATSAAGAPVPGSQGVGMEQPKQTKQQDAVHGEANAHDGAHKGHWDPMTQSFGEGYSTRADEEGFGTVYARYHDDDRPGHPEYDTSQGCEVREKEKGRHAT